LFVSVENAVSLSVNDNIILSVFINDIPEKSRALVMFFLNHVRTYNMKRIASKK
jgi:hypothetical protein